MSFEHTAQVTTKDGRTKTVMADNAKDLKAAVKDAENSQAPTTFDINVPVRKGHDLVAVDADTMDVTLADGTGAHNSPRDAVRDDGSIEGSDPLLVRPSNAVTSTEVKELVSDGELKDVDVDEVEVPSDKLNVPSNKQ